MKTSAIESRVIWITVLGLINFIQHPVMMHIEDKTALSLVIDQDMPLCAYICTYNIILKGVGDGQ
jgi:hypothetical protein